MDPIVKSIYLLNNFRNSEAAVDAFVTLLLLRVGFGGGETDISFQV